MPLGFPAGLNGFLLFFLLLLFSLSILLLLPPIIYDKMDRLATTRKFLKIGRNQVIIQAAGGGLVFVAVMALTISGELHVSCFYDSDRKKRKKKKRKKEKEKEMKEKEKTGYSDVV